MVKNPIIFFSQREQTWSLRFEGSRGPQEFVLDVPPEAELEELADAATGPGCPLDGWAGTLLAFWGEGRPWRLTATPFGLEWDPV